jgi:hypothetical protein
MITDQKVNGKYVGVYVIGDIETGVQFATTHKPNWFHRFFTRLFIGWKWMTIEALKTKKELKKKQENE